MNPDINPELLKNILWFTCGLIVIAAAFLQWRKWTEREDLIRAEKEKLVGMLVVDYKESWSFVEELAIDNSLPENAVGKCMVNLRAAGFTSYLAKKVLTELANSNWHSGGKAENLEQGTHAVLDWFCKGVLMADDKVQLIHNLPQTADYFKDRLFMKGSVNAQIEDLCAYLEDKNS